MSDELVTLTIDDVWCRKRDGRQGRIAHIFPGGSRLQYWIVGGPLNGRLRNHGVSTFLRQWEKPSEPAIVHPGRGWGATHDEAIAAARAEGRREGLEEAAKECDVLERAYDGLAETPYNTGAREMASSCRDNIRDLISQPPPSQEPFPTGHLETIARDTKCVEPAHHRTGECGRCLAEWMLQERAKRPPPSDPARDMAERIVGRLDAFVAEKARILSEADVERDAGRWMWCRDRWQMAKAIADVVRVEFLPAEKGTKT